MTPREYMNRYVSLDVRRKDGDTVKVTVDQYRRGDWGFDGAENWAIVNRLRTKGIDEGTVLQVGKEAIKIERHNRMETKGKKWEVLVGLPFWGKGSPEQCQLVLQLADYWGRARNGLQAYAKKLGLDCNGFVGNYLWHRMNQDWAELGHGKGHLGPNISITQQFDPFPLVTSWEELNPARMYVMAWVHDNGRVRPGGSDMGHIAITEPNEWRSAWDRHPSELLAVESWPDTFQQNAAQNKGLRTTWYKLLKFDAKKKTFKIKREGSSREMLFKLACVSG